MEIAKLGEFGLIRRLTESIAPTQSTTLKGVGDDCAVIAPTDGEVTLVTTDMLMEGVHFDLIYTPLKHLGYKAVAVNLSDLYAMNATPLSITAIGTARKEDIVCRNGAKETDLICVSGNLGAAYMGLQLLEREKTVYLQQSRESGGNTSVPFEPDFAGREYILERQLKPEPRRDIVARLKEAGIRPTSMIDISDGLSSELLHICHGIRKRRRRWKTSKSSATSPKPHRAKCSSHATAPSSS